MDPLVQHLPDLALAGALAWGAGLRLYLVVFGLGVAGWMDWLPLPEHLDAVSSPLVIGAAGFMALVELFADKLPWLDSLWDGVQTFIRIPAGARAAANTSPEPFSNLGLSLAEDALVIGGGWLAIAYPAVFLGMLAIFLIAALLLLRGLARGVGRLFGARPTAPPGR